MGWLIFGLGMMAGALFGIVLMCVVFMAAEVPDFEAFADPDR